MRNTEERLAAIHKKVQEQERQQRLRHSRLLGVSSLLGSLLIVTGVGIAMPGMMKTPLADGSGHLAVTASIFSQNGQLGYVVIALLSFVLGIAVTLLCVSLHRKNQREKEADDGRTF